MYEFVSSKEVEVADDCMMYEVTALWSNFGFT